MAVYDYTSDTTRQREYLGIREPWQNETGHGMTVTCQGCEGAAEFVEYGGRRYVAWHNLAQGYLLDFACDCYAWQNA